jgi:hypothetical protein
MNDGLEEVTLPSGEVVRVDPLRAAWIREQAEAPKEVAAPRRSRRNRQEEPQEPATVEVEDNG